MYIAKTLHKSAYYGITGPDFGHGSSENVYMPKGISQGVRESKLFGAMEHISALPGEYWLRRNLLRNLLQNNSQKHIV